MLVLHLRFVIVLLLLEAMASSLNLFLRAIFRLAFVIIALRCNRTMSFEVMCVLLLVRDGLASTDESVYVGRG